jgi:hypothetical protein
MHGTRYAEREVTNSAEAPAGKRDWTRHPAEPRPGADEDVTSRNVSV